jgi:hypothetical protein
MSKVERRVIRFKRALVDPVGFSYRTLNAFRQKLYYVSLNLFCDVLFRWGHKLGIPGNFRARMYWKAGRREVVPVFSGLAVARSTPSLKLVNRTVLLTAALFVASWARPAHELRSFAKSLHEKEILGRGGPWHLSTEDVSDALGAHGLQRGDKVAYIGESEDFYWARLAGVQVNAEIRQWNANYYLYSLAPNASV